MNETETTIEKKPLPWGFWPTVGFAGIIGVVYILIQVIIVIVFVLPTLMHAENFNIEQFAKSMETNGLFLSIATCVSAPFTIGLTILFAKIRKIITVRDYFCFYAVEWKELCKWSIVLIVFVACFDTATFLVGGSIVSKFMVDVYKTAYFLPLLWLTLLIIGPLAEELFFRGFLFKGIESSRLGAAGAVIVTSLTWSALHIQYDVYGIISIFLGGLLLGLARARSNSIYPPIVMHIIQNFISTVEVMTYLRMVPADF
jgi:membrane protease YdiL (CAAX protease family)